MQKLNKAGNLSDVPFVIKALFVFAFVFLIALVINSEINDKVQASSEFTNTSKVFYAKYVTNSNAAADSGFVLLFLGFFVISVIGARLIPTNAVFFVLGIIYIILSWLLAIFFSYFWKTLSEGNALLSAMVVNLPMTNFIMLNLLYFMLFYTFVLAVALYTKDSA